MEWTIKITDKPKERILVIFNPLTERLDFIGQHKPHNKSWINFCEKSITIWLDDAAHSAKGDTEIITIDTIQNILSDTYLEMKIRLDAYENLAEGFSVIREIEIQDESPKPPESVELPDPFNGELPTHTT